MKLESIQVPTERTATITFTPAELRFLHALIGPTAGKVGYEIYKVLDLLRSENVFSEIHLDGETTLYEVNSDRL